MADIRNFIDGAWRTPSGTAEWDVLDPSTTAVLATGRVSTAGDVDAAVTAARRALPGWAARTHGERAGILNALADRLIADADTITALEVANAGKPLSAFRDDELPAILDASRYFASAGRSMSAPASGEYIEGRTSISRREPVGVVAAITPWNFPLLQVILKVIPALSVGNTVVLKPAELTPLTAQRLAELTEGLLPPGVLNVVQGPGDPTGAALVAHRDVALVSFTGSVAAGRAIARSASDGLKRVVLELGGNAPALVFDDADLDAAVTTLAACAFGNAGQDCTASSRQLVQRNVYDRFVDKLVTAAGQVRIGATSDEKTELGPLISAAQRGRVEALIDGRSRSSRLVAGGTRPDMPGFYLAPTIIADVEQSEPIVQQEIFGPVVTVQPFDTDEEALAYANGTRYGLAASVWTRDLTRAHRFAIALNAGSVWINDHTLFSPDVPQGGYGDSGYGKENGVLGAEELTRLKQVSVNLGS
jgi:betaine-aldehyde dehydrogenase